MKLRCFFYVFAVAAVLPAFAEKVSLDSLLDEMTDLNRLATLAGPAYTCKQFSSYDQRSTDPAVPTDENWFANGDRGQYLREETRDGKKEYVLMDTDGPGAIVNFWSANPVDAGTVYIYLDGKKEPAAEMLLTELLGGGKFPFVKPISIELSKGWTSYLPIPYAKHCKVTTSKPDFYYHIDYRTYAKGTGVKTFTLKDAEKLSDKINNVAKKLEDPETAIASAASTQEEAGDLMLAPGESQEFEFYGPAAITGIRSQVNADKPEAALRGTLLEITFDGHATPDVQVPLGDFFGTAPGVNKYKGLPAGVGSDGSFYSHWVMPFKSSALVKLTNTTASDVELSGSVSASARPWDDDSLYFHAKWRGVRDLSTRPRQDFTFLDATGKGRFVGVEMHVTNPVSDWWGEGDEKVYVDGEKFPSWFGTGSEDYFNYAWCWNQVYTQAYHAQSRCDGPGNFGQTSNNRFHVMDDIPFTQSFKFDFEVWHWAECKIAQSVVAYWYTQAGGMDRFEAPKREELVVSIPPIIKGVEGAIEGETLKVISASAGQAARQDMIGKWSLSSQLWWTGAQPGATLVLGFDIEKAGSYEVFANFTKAVDYGIATVAVNQDPAGEPRDFYTKSGVKVTGEVSLGVHALKKGQNTLTITITGTNKDAKPSHMVGVDYLKPVAK